MKILQDLGAENILNSTDADFPQKLQDLAKQLRATVVLEAIGGKMTGQILSKMPSNSTCMLYGCLSEQPVGDVDPLLLIGRNQRIEGFLVSEWLGAQGLWTQIGTINRAAKLIATKGIHSDVAKRISLWEVREGIPEYKKNMTAGKYLIYPHQEKPSATSGNNADLLQPGHGE